MPLYDIRCEKTGYVFERLIPLAKFEEPIICACHSPASRLISTPMISVDQTGYSCPVTGKWIRSKREHRENLQRQGCRVLEGGEKEQNEQRRAEADAELDRKVEETVERTIDSYPSAKREKLYNEMVNCDIAVERK